MQGEMRVAEEREPRAVSKENAELSRARRHAVDVRETDPEPRILVGRLRDDRQRFVVDRGGGDAKIRSADTSGGQRDGSARAIDHKWKIYSVMADAMVSATIALMTSSVGDRSSNTAAGLWRESSSTE